MMMHGLNYMPRNSRKRQYARAYIEVQVYENLLSLNDAYKAGTIFMDLYMPYDKKLKAKC